MFILAVYKKYIHIHEKYEEKINDKLSVIKKYIRRCKEM